MRELYPSERKFVWKSIIAAVGAMPAGARAMHARSGAGSRCGEPGPEGAQEGVDVRWFGRRTEHGEVGTLQGGADAVDGEPSAVGAVDVDQARLAADGHDHPADAREPVGE